MTNEEFLQKMDAGEKFTEEELRNLRWESELVEVTTTSGDKHRWHQEKTTIFKVGDRLFALNWMEGLTECQEDEYYDQPYEVEEVQETKVITNYKTKEVIKVVEEEKIEELVVVNNGVAVLDPFVSYQLAMAEMKINEMKEFQDGYKDRIQKEMEARGVIKVHSEHLEISYTNPTTRETFDSKKFKEDHLDLYNQYIKTSNVKGSVKLKCLLGNTK